MAKINTITDQQWADIQRRADKVAPPLFSREAVSRRKQDTAQRAKAGLS